jgi:hypothetical protein
MPRLQSYPGSGVGHIERSPGLGIQRSLVGVGGLLHSGAIVGDVVVSLDTRGRGLVYTRPEAFKESLGGGESDCGVRE